MHFLNKNRCLLESLYWQLCLLSLLLLLGTIYIFFKIPDDVIKTELFFIIVSVVGWMLCVKVQNRLPGLKVNVIGYLWPIKIGLVLAIICFSWEPILQSGTGYDPVRYFYQAQGLADGSLLKEDISLNYLGILYYYAVIFFCVGSNSLAPALMNCFITLIATLYLIETIYVLRGKCERVTWWGIGAALMLPEIIWYDALTSREPLISALLIFSMLSVGRSLLGKSSISKGTLFLLVGGCIFLIATIRTSMLVPFMSATILMYLFLKSGSSFQKIKKIIIGTSFICAIIFIGEAIREYSGGNAVSIFGTLQAAISAKDNVALAGGMSFNENSMSLLFMPDGLLQALIFIPPRMVLYLLAPLPNIIEPMGKLLTGDPGEWQTLFTILSSIINLVLMPYVLAGLFYAVKKRKQDAGQLVLQIAYWCTFAAIAGGNLIVHERYRAMSALLMFGCAWLAAQKCPTIIINNSLKCWYGLLFFSTIPFMIYKNS